MYLLKSPNDVGVNSGPLDLFDSLGFIDESMLTLSHFIVLHYLIIGLINGVANSMGEPS